MKVKAYFGNSAPNQCSFGYGIMPKNKSVNTVSGISPLIINNAKSGNIINYRIYGNSVQCDIPTPYAPAEIQNTGDLITDINDNHCGMYNIPISVNDTDYSIYLDEPLRAIGNYSDYIDYKSGSVIRNIGVLYINSVNFIKSGMFRYSIKHIGQKVLCNYYQPSTYSSLNNYVIYSNIYYFSFNDNRFDNEQDFNLWLAELIKADNPLIIYYPLLSPTAKKIILPEINLQKKNNTLNFFTKTPASNIILSYLSL